MAFEISSTETEWRFVPDPKTPPPQRGRVVAPVRIYGVARTRGDVLEMDANTYRNLCADGRVEPFTEEQTAEEVISEIEQEKEMLTTLADFGPQKTPRRGRGRPRKQHVHKLRPSNGTERTWFICAECGAEKTAIETEELVSKNLAVIEP